MIAVFINNNPVNAKASGFLLPNNQVLKVYERNTGYHEQHAYDLVPRNDNSIEKKINHSSKEWRSTPDCLGQTNIETSLTRQSVGETDRQKHCAGKERCHCDQHDDSDVELPVATVE